jgi:hypothetical protein
MSVSRGRPSPQGCCDEVPHAASSSGPYLPVGASCPLAAPLDGTVERRGSIDEAFVSERLLAEVRLKSTQINGRCEGIERYPWN